MCSVALSEGGEIVSYVQDATRSHASLTAPFVKQVLDERGLSVKDCDAVCVGMGPGSYTGLRVGASTAKGLCMGGDIPLIAVGSLDALVWQALGSGEGEKYSRIVPMIDARRMEVFTSVFSSEGKQLSPTEAKIIDKDSFSDILSEGPVLFTGDGAKKCESLIDNPSAHFREDYPTASGLLRVALSKYEEKKFEDVAYFEPFYLKDFIATVSKKRIPGL